MRWVLVALSAAMLMSASPARGGDMAWAGAGAVSCAKFAQLYQSNPDYFGLVFTAWAQGFMSGLNTGIINDEGQAANISNSEAHLQHIQIYCSSRPLSFVVEAVMDLFDSLRSQQGLSDWRSPWLN